MLQNQSGHEAELAHHLLLPGLDSYAVAVGTFAFLFTDIEGSTTLLQRAGGDVYARVLSDHHRLIRSALTGHGGTEVDTAGDGFFAVFSAPQACVAAALEMQQALESHAWPGGEHVRVRMGVHAGEAERTATGLVGLDVHRAARIAAVAHGGQVLVSAAALADGVLPPGAGLRDLGSHRLKDLGRPEQIFQLCAAGLQAEFAPLRSLGNPMLRNNLPTQLATFIGRSLEIGEVRALVESARLVTLTGAGGAGKTRLSLQVAAEFLDGSGDGVWLVELAAVTDQNAVAAAIADALRIPPQPGQPALDTLYDALEPQDILIVLDNCEHLIDGCAKTVETILQRCPKLHLIATSREPLGIAGETIYQVPSLSLPTAAESDPVAAASCDAVALLVDRARAQGVGLVLDADTSATIVSVCRRLDGIPLAIELAAARLRSMSLDELAGRLDQRFRLLTGGSRTALARQQTLRAAVDWSYSLLTSAEQVLLGRLSVFAGGFDLAAAEAVCGYGAIDALEVAGLLGSMVDKSLVVAEPGGAALRYRLLETIRLFAAEQLADVGGPEAAAARLAHCAHYLTIAEAAAPLLTGREQGIWFDRLEADQANFRRAVEHAAGEPAGTSQVLRFGVALWRYWRVRSRNEEAAGLLVPALRRPEAAADPALFAEALVAAAFVTVFTDLATSLRLAEQANEVAGGLGDDRLLAMSRGMLGWAYVWAGELERARALAQEAVRQARQLGDDVLLGLCLKVQAYTAGAAASGSLYVEAIACTERSGDVATRRDLLNNAGWAALEIGDIAAARAHLEAAIRAAEIIRDPYPVSTQNLGWVLRAEHDLDGAWSRFGEALRTSRLIGSKRYMAGAINGLACLATDMGDWDRAAVLHGAAQALQDQTGVQRDRLDDSYRRESLGQAYATLGGEQAQRAYADGTALSLSQVVDLALRELPPGTRPPPTSGTESAGRTNE
jgi:predicted ATPase/class 3 adenylate cyclase/Tfp pilus assembly protein PilF